MPKRKIQIRRKRHDDISDAIERRAQEIAGERIAKLEKRIEELTSDKELLQLDSSILEENLKRMRAQLEKARITLSDRPH